MGGRPKFINGRTGTFAPLAYTFIEPLGIRRRGDRGRSPHLRTLLLNHWGLDVGATEDGRPYSNATQRRASPALHPLDPSLSAENVINCRCIHVYVLRNVAPSENLQDTIDNANERQYTNKYRPQQVDDLLSQGKNVKVLTESTVQGEPTPDFRVDGVPTELKTLNGTSLNTPVTRIQNGFEQNAQTVILDDRNSGLIAPPADGQAHKPQL